MRFIDYVNSLPNEKELFIKRICELTLCNKSTVSRWLNGENTPSKSRREVIARELNIPEEELFPEINKKP